MSPCASPVLWERIWDVTAQVSSRWDQLCWALRLHAYITKRPGEMDGAFVLHREDERLCRKSDQKAEVISSFIQHAILLVKRADLPGALAVLAECERLSRQGREVEGLVEAQHLIEGVPMRLSP